MLPKKHRLAKSEFGKVFKKGKRFKGKAFTLIILPDAEKKIGIVITKNVFKKAVERNRAKRRVRDILKEFVGKAEGKMIVLAGPKTAGMGYGEMREEIASLIQKIS